MSEFCIEWILILFIIKAGKKKYSGRFTMDNIIKFRDLEFTIVDDAIYLTKFSRIKAGRDTARMFLYAFLEAQVAGEMKETHMGIKLASSSEIRTMKYVSHKAEGDTFEVVQRSKTLEAKTVFTYYPDTSAVRVYSEYKNITEGDIVLEDCSAFKLTGFGRNGVLSYDKLSFYSFTSSQYNECQPRKRSFFDYGMFPGTIEGQKRISFANIGTWSTKEQLPQGIIEDSEEGYFLMFQIESNNAWYYEISDTFREYYLYLGGGNLSNTSWAKKLAPGEAYRTVNCALAIGSTLNEVLGEMTKYRRHIMPRCESDRDLPAIYNEYMHVSWDNPTAETTAKYAPTVAKTGVKYYVIDCGWHNEEDGNKVYPYVGQWKESKARFPEGVKATTDLIRSLGMKPGLWIEPEIVGYLCDEMLDYYDEDCFISRFGRKVANHRRYFLDYRNPKVREYMSETIRRMIEDYGAEYIKCDYNQDLGVGTDKDSDSLGEGLEQITRAYLSWIDEMRDRFSDVIFETCSSGGMRMDYETLSHFSLVSTSDQTNYYKYPFIASNVLAGVLPEQAAVWSYPVSRVEGFSYVPVDGNIADEVIILNMINSFLGRMHLASHLEWLSEEKLAIVKEGVEYYDSLTEGKKRGLPYLPLGFSNYEDKSLASGYIVDGKKLYLAVWNIGGERKFNIPLDRRIGSARVGYPANVKTDFTVSDNVLTVNFDNDYMARFFEIELD